MVALSADHGVVPIPEDMQKTGVDAGVLHLPEVQERIEKALEPLNYPKPAIARITGSDIYFVPGVYEKLKGDPAAMNAVIDAIKSVPGVADVYRAEQLGRPSRHAKSDARSDGRQLICLAAAEICFIVPKPYLADGWNSARKNALVRHGAWNAL